MAAQTQPDYVESNITPVQNSTRQVGTSIFVGGPQDSTMSSVQVHQQLIYSPGVFVGVDGHRN